MVIIEKYFSVKNKLDYFVRGFFEHMMFYKQWQLIIAELLDGALM